MKDGKLLGRSRVQVKSLPAAVQKELKRAFAETHCMDLYRGDAPTYLNVIATHLRQQRERIEKLEKAIKTVYAAFKDANQP